MELSQLKHFKVTSRHKNLTRAAEELHLSQPALSISISKLEKELGAALFDRGRGGLQLTSVGSSFLFWCNEALNAIDSGVREVRDLCDTGGGLVRVAVSEAVFIKHLTRDFLKTHSKASLQCFLMTNEQMRSAIYDSTVDFVISRGPVTGPDIYWSPVYEDYLTALMSVENPLARKPSLLMEELASSFFLVGDLKQDMHSFIYQQCHAAGFTPKIRYEGHDSDVATLLLVLENTVMLTCNSTNLAVEAEIPGVSDVIAVPISDANVQPLGLGFRSNRYQSVAVMEFYDMAQRFYSALPT